MTEEDEKRFNEDMWRHFAIHEREWIGNIFNERVTRQPVAVMPPPTRAETIKEAWRTAGLTFDAENINGKLEGEDVLGIVPPVLYEVVEYGTDRFIEAEGVIVERITPQVIEIA